MSWADAAALAGPVIDAAFADPAEITFHSLAAGTYTFPAILIDAPAEIADRQGRNLRKNTWELPQAELPGEPNNRGDYLVHAGRKWRVLEVEARNDIGKWWVIVQDWGAA